MKNNVASAYQIGGGKEMWNGKSFDYDVFTALKTALFGDADPVTYIKDNADANEKNKYTTQSTVVKAPKINAKVGNTTYGAVVKLGGLDWIVTSLTLKGEISANGMEVTEIDKPVVTLLLADDLKDSSNNVITTKWHGHSVSEKGANMYSMSAVRNNLVFLSGTDANSPFKALSMFSNSSDFAEKFLVQPKYIKYQQTETHTDRGWRSYYYVNEALAAEKMTAKWYSCFGTYFTDRNVQYDGTKNSGGGRVAKYADWGNDYMWLPSLVECGFSSFGGDVKTIWGLTDTQRYPSAVTLYRSTNYDSLAGLAWLNASNDYSYHTGGKILTGGMRPAIHLDLEMVEKYAGVQIPEDTVKEYNGAEQYLTDQSWYRSDVFNNPDLGTVTYKKNGSTVTSVKDAGTYTVIFRLLDTETYFWTGDKENDTRTMTFTITPKPLEVKFTPSDNGGYPTVAFKEGSEPYSGDSVNIVLKYTSESGATLTEPPTHKGNYTVTASVNNPNYKLSGRVSYDFELLARRVNLPTWNKDAQTYIGGELTYQLSYDPSIFKITVPSEFEKPLSDGGITVNRNRFTVKNAGKYRVTVSILDEEGDTLWNDRDDHLPRDVEFEVLPATYRLTFSESTLVVAYGQKTTATIYASPAYEGDEISVTIYANTDEFFPDELAKNVKFGSETMAEGYKVELRTNELPEGSFPLSVEGDNPNYDVCLPSDGVTLTVSEITSTPSVTWVLRNSKKQIAVQTVMTAEASFPNAISYDGQVYYITATSNNLGFTIDRTYNENGFTKGIKTENAAGEAAQGVNAGLYKTTVRLLSSSDVPAEYSVTFEIEKAKIDFNEVRWQNEGKMPYTGKVQSCELIGLPEGVTASYVGALSGRDVAKIGKISASFSLSKEAEQNYIKPVKGDPDSYTGDFAWEIDWEIVPLTIPLNWKIEGLRDANGALFNGYVLENGGDFIRYYFYETDRSGNVLEGAEPLEEITAPTDEIKYYKVKATIAEGYTNNYKLETEDEAACYSGFFEVGHPVTEVRVAVTKTSYTYWGSPVGFQFRATMGGVDTSYFNVTYWDGYTQLSGAPTNVGNYRAEISLKREYRNSYSLQGDNSFEFMIERATIAIDWNESAKPPMLVLKNTLEAKAVEYEYIDENNNPVIFSGLQRGSEYAVRAVIKDTQNFVFEGGATATEWKGFSISTTDTIVDPTNPSNPFYPTEKPENPNATGGDQEIKTVILTHLNPTLYANANGYSQDALFFNNLGLPQSMFEFVYKKDGAIVQDWSTAGTYTVEVSLKATYAGLYQLSDDSKVFTFTVLENGGGNTTTTPGGDEGDNPSDGTVISYLPVILSGVSVILIVVFLIMTMNNLSAAKAAREKTKKLAATSYSFAPAGLLAIVLGLSETNWWIIAGVLMGLALITAVAAFMSKGKKKRALEALEEEQERVAEEKELAKEERMREEQARRDNEMKMMFAAMQQGGGYGQAPMQYEDMQNMIASTVSALLPTIQQQMALPPAQSDQSVYGANPEADALRAQLAAQQEQMAQQQELLNRILQNQQTQQAYEYEEEVEDDISWLGESDEVVSLEESYGALDDEGKRYYYEIGSYIMSKPRISQNDGRYAVLFRYRGRTIFKLAIKDDAPVLYYPAGSGRGEVRVFDASSLEVAKSMIDRTVMSADSQM